MMPSSDLQGHDMHVVHIHTQVNKMLIYIK